jgi:hypothetical protein
VFKSVQCCLTFDGVQLLQASDHDVVVASKDGYWLLGLLTAPPEEMAYLRDQWLRLQSDGA